VKCATGGGKTVIFTAIIKALGADTPTVCLFRTKTLVDQTYGVLQRFGIPNIGRVRRARARARGRARAW
jgi:superfamily II DNA or RNA helicase